MRTIGVDSLSVVILSGISTGILGYYSVRQFSAENHIGSAVALSLLRELGLVFSALMVTVRTGSAMRYARLSCGTLLHSSANNQVTFHEFRKFTSARQHNDRRIVELSTGCDWHLDCPMKAMCL